MEKPQALSEDGKNLDPTKCDCGKGEYCPLWNQEWASYYGYYYSDGIRGYKIDGPEDKAYFEWIMGGYEEDYV